MTHPNINEENQQEEFQNKTQCLLVRRHRLEINLSENISQTGLVVCSNHYSYRKKVTAWGYTKIILKGIMSGTVM